MVIHKKKKQKQKQNKKTQKTNKQPTNHKVSDLRMIFDLTSVEVTCVTLPKDHCVQVP